MEIDNLDPECSTCELEGWPGVLCSICDPIDAGQYNIVDDAEEDGTAIAAPGWPSMAGILAAEARARGQTVEAMNAAGQGWRLGFVDLESARNPPPFSADAVMAAVAPASPIERMLLAAILDAAGEVARPTHPQAIALVDGFNLFAQHPIGRYSADFAIVNTATGAGVVVEADGHAYHDRTKARASHDRRRDRFIQAQGWYVARFTGADIYRDAEACALEAMSFVRARN